MRSGVLFWPFLAALLLGACSTVPPVEVDDTERARRYQERHDQLSGFPDWSLAGRLAVSDGKDGGSGRFRWNQMESGSAMDFHGAMGRGAWRMTSDTAGARLELADGTVHDAVSIDILVRSHLGWDIPVDSLAWWVRGLAAPGGYQERRLGEDGDIQELMQDGWTVTFDRYRSFGGARLPVRLTARQADWKVKLAIRDWSLPAEDGPDD